jgi:phosphogluconate dehydratase
MVLEGNLGRAVIKISSVPSDRSVIEAPAMCFEDQAEIESAFKSGRLAGDFVAVVRFQGPKANGMPELHKLSPILGVLQERGQRVALLTDGRMSGASGKIPAAIHVVPEALDEGPIALIRDGDIIRIDAEKGEFAVRLDDDIWASRRPAQPTRAAANARGLGRELFTPLRAALSRADQGASVLGALAETA